MASLDMYFLDVGQGDGTFIVFPNQETMLVDLGSNKNAKKAGLDAITTIEYIIAKESLKKTIDYLILTHGDSDHYNLIDKLMAKKITIKKVYFGGRINDYGVGKNNLFQKIKNANPTVTFKSFKNGGRVTPKNNTKFTAGGVDFSVLSANNYNDNKNQNSIVLWFEYYTNSVLLTGDADYYVEDLIMNEIDDLTKLESTILKLGHHGSDTSTSQDWLDQVKPTFVFTSCDNHESYNHPHINVIDRVLKTTSIKKQNSSLNHGWVIGNNESKGVSVPNLNTNTLSQEYYNVNSKFVGVASQDAIFSNLYKLVNNSSGFTAYGTCYMCQLGDDKSLTISYYDIETDETVRVFPKS